MESPRGWFEDPYGRYPRRYYNGEKWTDQVQIATGEVVTETSAATEVDPPAEPTPDTSLEPLSFNHDNPKEKSKRNAVAIAIGVLLTLGVIGAITEDEEASDESNPESAPTEGVGSQAVETNVSEDTSQPVPMTGAPVTATVGTSYSWEAFDMAASYLRYSSFSRDGLINQLEYEGYTTEDATAAVDAQGADWNAQAVGSAESYLGFTAFSRQGLIDQLEYEGYTNSQATFGADTQNADWNEQASRAAQSYLDFADFTRQELVNQLLFDDFSQSEAEYGVNAVGL